MSVIPAPVGVNRALQDSMRGIQTNSRAVGGVNFIPALYGYTLLPNSRAVGGVNRRLFLHTRRGSIFQPDDCAKLPLDGIARFAEHPLRREQPLASDDPNCYSQRRPGSYSRSMLEGYGRARGVTGIHSWGGLLIQRLDGSASACLARDRQ